MTQDEIIKRNKAIAEFMGAKYKKDVSFDLSFDEVFLPMHGICNYGTIELGKGKILKYHSSWQWLMPAMLQTKCISITPDCVSTQFGGFIAARYQYPEQSEIITTVFIAVSDYIMNKDNFIDWAIKHRKAE